MPPKTHDEITEQRAVASRKQAELKKKERACNRALNQHKRDQLEQLTTKIKAYDLDKLGRLGHIINNFDTQIVSSL